MEIDNQQWVAKLHGIGYIKLHVQVYPGSKFLKLLK